MRIILVGFIAAASIMTPFIASGNVDVEWNRQSYDFGAIREEMGEERGEFLMVNKGETPVTILRVKTSCGCTQAEYPKESVAPGDTASITFSYNPLRRPGKFEKSIKVYLTDNAKSGKATEEGAEVSTLHIRGTVIASPETLEADYPIEIGGGLRSSGKMVNLGDIKYGASRHGFLQLYNAGDRPMTMRITGTDSALRAALMPDTINSGENGIISICLDTAREPRSGELKYDVSYEVQGSEIPSAGSIKIWANIEPEPKPVVKKSGRYGKVYTEPKVKEAGKREKVKIGKSEKVTDVKKKGKYGNTYVEVKKPKSAAEEEASRTNKGFSGKYIEINK